MKNIVFIGMRGSGKSTIAKLLGKKLGRKVIEMDQQIVGKENMSIPEIVAKHGWDYFREKEANMAQTISKLANVVISASGGVVLKQTSIKALRKTGTLIYLRANPETLVKRIGIDPNRPPLTGQKSLLEEVTQILSERKMLYETSANVIIDNESLSIEETIENIERKLSI